MNKIQKRGSAVLYGDPEKFQTYENGYGPIQIRDNRSDKQRKNESVGTVAVLPTMGGQYATYQDYKGAKTLARKIVRVLNA